MASDKRVALMEAIRARIAMANDLLPAAQRRRFPGFTHPPMLFHWHEDWDDMSLADLLDVCTWIDGIVARLEKYR
jgi:hypothetical protein